MKMIDFLRKASDAYYDGQPFISDEEFDSLAETHNFSEVGHKVTDGVSHWFPLFSLQKKFDLVDVDTNGFVRSPKLDGAAVSILYVNGLMQLALTRGDGRQGRDITEHMKHIAPRRLPSISGVVQIAGEVVAEKHIKNARNYAAGSLGLKDPSAVAHRELSFVAYDMAPVRFDSWTESMEYLHSERMETVLEPQGDYPTDGEVFRIDDNKKFIEMGYTSHHPRGAFALKEQKEGIVTELLDVVWQVGKSGIVSPVAILSPINIGGATVSRATLHNIEYIEQLGLEIGCKVSVVRSGEIIPRILKRV